MRKICKGLVLAGVAAALLLPGSAAAVSLGQLYQTYSKQGKIDPCAYSSAELQSALDGIPTDVQQYDPRFAEALRNALKYRAAGGCHKGSGSQASSPGTFPVFGNDGSGGSRGTAPDGSPKPPGAPAVTTRAALAAETAPASFDAGRGFPLALGVLAAIVALILAGVGYTALARRYGWDIPGPPN